MHASLRAIWLTLRDPAMLSNNLADFEGVAGHLTSTLLAAKYRENISRLSDDNRRSARHMRYHITIVQQIDVERAKSLNLLQ